jgi:hypothetical protein
MYLSLPSGLEDVNLERTWVSDEGEYIDTSGNKQKLLNIVFENLVKMRVGEKVIIQDTEASRI